MKKQYKLFLMVFLVFFVACEDFLNETNPNEVTEETFWTTLEDAQSGISAAYGALQINAVFNGRGWEIMNGRSDEYKCDSFLNLLNLRSLPSLRL